MKKNILAIMAALMLTASCTKQIWNDPRCSLIVNNEQVNVGTTTARIQCDYTIKRNGPFSSHATPYIVYGESESEMHDTIMESLGIIDGQDLETYTRIHVSLDGLKANTSYYYYYLFKNGYDSIWSETKTFKTENNSGGGGVIEDVPIGAVNGLFTINANGDQVYFSQGNLQYQASTNTWRFAENQWNYVGTQIPDEAGYMGGNVNGSDNHLISSTYSGWIDLFGWGTSGWNNGNVRYQPYDTEESWPYGGYGPCDGTNYEYDLTGTYANADWGVYNAIANGGDVSNLWRTLIRSEWVYVFNDRTTTSGIRFAKGVVNGVNGVILLPDDWSASLYTLNFTNTIDVPYSTNEIILADWRMMEANGVVFLPASGYRNWTSISVVDDAGGYWSASYGNASEAYGMHMSVWGLATDLSNRHIGLSVRLVQNTSK